jgi:hypothetical protein
MHSLGARAGYDFAETNPANSYNLKDAGKMPALQNWKRESGYREA